MYKVIQKLRILPRWIILLIDLVILFFAVCFGYLLRFDFDFNRLIYEDFLSGALLFMLSGGLSILITKSYAGIIRFTTIQDGLRIVYMATMATMITLIVNLVYLNFDISIIPRSVIIISFFNAVIFLFSYRLVVKYIFSYFTNSIHKRANIVIFGAGRFGQITKQVVDSDTSSNSKVVAFLDDDPRKIGKVINGVKIYNPRKDLAHLVLKLDAHELIIASSEISLDRTNEIVDQCLKVDIKVRRVPQPDKWVKGELSVGQIKEVKIEDLLGRASVQLDNVNVRKQLKDRRVLVTGAGGSIGSEIVRQIMRYNPETLILLDQGETPLYEIEREVRLYKSTMNIHAVIGDVRNRNRMEIIFDQFRPQVVYHAAAYKHVPMMENNATEAVLCNVCGTKCLADLAVRYHAEKFVMISTDKAVNPTNVMGASKRIAEIYVQSLSSFLLKESSKRTAFITTRFGNVLGSNGSVIPLFKKQLAKGGPVTVTHPEMTRYFMTIPEACQLSLEAGAMGEGNEIFIIDMGKSVKIVDLARKMIQLSGKELGKDVEIVFTGLRHGEKLYEELLNNKENTIPTHHPKIMIAKIREEDYHEVKFKVDELIQVAQDGGELEMVRKMKQIVPEFISNQSKYEELDKKVLDL